MGYSSMTLLLIHQYLSTFWMLETFLVIPRFFRIFLKRWALGIETQLWLVQIWYFPDLVYTFLLLPTARRRKLLMMTLRTWRVLGDLYFTDFSKIGELKEQSAAEERLTASHKRICLYFIPSKILLKLLQLTVLWKAKDNIIESRRAE